MDTVVIDEVVERLKALPGQLQWRVLEFTRSLSQAAPRGKPGKEMLRFAGTISPEDAQRMSDAIERGCEQVDADGW